MTLQTSEARLVNDKSRWRSLGLWIQGITLALFAWLVATRYYLKPYSDPLNWLKYARNLGEWRTSRWPLLYPLFLRGILEALGPYAVFLANAPLLALMLWLAGRIAAQSLAEDHDLEARRLVAALTMGALLWFDPDLLVYLVNPYRDPLALVFLLAATSLMIAYARGKRGTWKLTLAGLCVGLSTSVREPSALAVAPLALFGLACFFTDHNIRFWRSAIAFAVGLGLGALPLLLQSYLTSGNPLVPPQAAVEQTMLPGIVPTRFRVVSQRMLEYAILQLGWWGVLVVALAFLAAPATRNRELLALLIPMALTFGLFYLNYVNFVRRYFFAAVLFAIPATAVSVTEIAKLVLRRLNGAQVLRTALRVTALAVAVSAMVRVVRAPHTFATFRIPHARAFERDVQAVLSRGSLVFAPRFLCETLEYFLDCRSYPIGALSGWTAPADSNFVGALKSFLENEPAVYLMEVFDSAGRNDGGGEWARQYVRTVPVTVFSNAAYHLGAICGDHHGWFVVHRLEPWRNLSVERKFDSSGGPAVLRFDAKMLWNGLHLRTRAQLLADDRVIATRVYDGLNYIAWNDPPSGSVSLRLESDAPLPDHIVFELQRPNDPINFPLRPGAFPAGISVLAPDGRWAIWRPFEEWFAFRDQAGLTIPADLAGGEDYLLELRLRTRDRTRARITLHDLQTDEHHSQTLSADKAFQSVVWRRPGAIGETHRFTLKAETTVEIELGRVSVYPLRASYPVRVVLGTIADEPFVGEGWYAREGREPRTYRWSSTNAALRIFAPRALGPLRLQLRFREAHRHPSVRSSNLALRWNGEPLSGTLVHPESEAEPAVLEARLAPERILYPENELRLVCAPFRPSDYGRGDARTLGVIVEVVEIQTESSGTQDAKSVVPRGDGG